MKWMIASDLHGSAAWCRRLLEAFEQEGAERLVLLGDLLYHGPRNPLPDEYDPPAVTAMLNGIKNHLLCVRGNCDAEVDAIMLPFPLAQSAWLNADGVRIFAVHGHALPAGGTFPGLAAGSAQLSGHTHIPRAEGREGIHFCNPGSASLPKADFPRSYGVIENGAFSVFPLAGGAELMRDAVRCGA